MSPGPEPGPGGGDTAPWVVLAVIGGGVAAFTLAWAGGTLGVLLAGEGWAPRAYSFRTAFALVHGTGQVWPGHATAATVGIVLVAVLGVTAVVAAAWGWVQIRPGHTGLASRRDLAPLTPRATRARARQLRPSLADHRRIDPDETGIPLGAPRAAFAPMLRASFEDTILAVMAPRAGKTTALAVPAMLAAPGPVLATSNKADLYLTTAAARTDAGTVWVLDPQRILHLPRTTWWDMLATATTIEGAGRLASHFITAGTDAAHRDFWTLAGKNLLTGMFHAAALDPTFTVADVLSWLATPTDRAPVEILRGQGRTQLGQQVAATIAGAPETRDGIYETARQAVACLLDPGVLAWVTPDPETPRFDPDRLVTSRDLVDPATGAHRPGRDTVYLLSKDGGGSAAGLIAAAADAVLRAATDRAERVGGRLDPPLLAVLDEAANICRIEDLPDLYSHLGSRGVVPLTILQSYQQGVRVWGEHGMDALWSAATTKLIGPGTDDAEFADKLSRLLGEHYVTHTSVSRGGYGASTATSHQRERIMDVGQIRRLPKGSALLLATGLRAGIIRLRPWYTGPSAATLTAQHRRALHALTDRAATR